MKNYQKDVGIYFWALLAIGCCSVITTSCGPSAAEKLLSEEAASMIASHELSSSAALPDSLKEGRMFIRTADLKFRVKNVVDASYRIEEIACRRGGFVTATELHSEIENTIRTAVSADSSLEVTRFNVSNSITIRVLNRQLDSTLKEISGQIVFLDLRVIKAQDVSFELLANDYAQKRGVKNENRLMKAIDQKGKKLKETAIVEEMVLLKQEEGDKAHISNLSLNDQINYITIHLSLYEPTTTRQELVANIKEIKPFEPGFGIKLMDSFQFGWKLFEGILLFIAKLWILFIIALISYFLSKKMAKKLA